MLTLRVTVPRLRKRNSIPVNVSDLSSVAGEVFAGNIVYANAVPQSQVPTPASGTWYKDRDNYFYWGGGLEPLTTAAADQPGLISGIAEEWLKTKGGGVKIAVMDSGFYLDHPDLAHLKNSCYIADKAGNGNTDDLKGHGTHVLGLLSGKPGSLSGVTGLAPDASYFLYKVRRDKIGIVDSFVEAAIRDAVDREVHIINLSLDVPAQENNDLHKAVRLAQSRGILVVAAARENEKLLSSALRYPAQYAGVLSTGAVDKTFARNNAQPFNPALDFILPLIAHRSCWNSSQAPYKEELGSSMSTAIVSGVLACAKAAGLNDPSAALKNAIDPFSPGCFEDDQLKITKP